MIFIFNGPPASGKDAACLFFQSLGFKHLSFKHELFKETIKHFGVNHDWFMERYDDRAIKDRKETLLKGMSRREAMIYVSEEIIKPKHGKSFFGDQVSNEICVDTNYCISDGGFIEELVPIINKVGANEIILVQITRKDCNFYSDSRRYFDGDIVEEFVIENKTNIPKIHFLSKKLPIRSYRVHNNGTLKEFYCVLQQIYEREKDVHEERKTKDFFT